MRRVNTLRSTLERTSPGLQIRPNFDLTKKTSMRMYTRAAVYAKVENPLGLRDLMHESGERGIPAFLLGGGFNTIFAQSYFEGIVYSLEGSFKDLEYIGNNIVRAGSGVKLPQLLSYVRKQGLMGLEFLTMVPGTVGGALAGNAGAGNWGLCDLVERVSLMTRDGYIANVCRNQFRYSYRHSDLRDATILEADLRLWPLNRGESDRRIEEYKSKKTNQPYNTPSSGCIFKNPKDPATGLPVSAGKLIDQCGLKGYRIRSAAVSKGHANFIVNHGDSCGEDFLALISLIRDIVYSNTGIELEMEAQIVGGPLNSVVLT